MDLDAPPLEWTPQRYLLPDSQSLTDLLAENLRQTIEHLRANYDSGLTRSLAYRRKALRTLAYALQDNRSQFAAAYSTDLGSGANEMSLLELDRTIDEIVYLEANLESFSRPEPVSGGLAFPFSSPNISREPYGVVLIYAPWNYPLQLAVIPLAGAIAAGNAVILKVSEHAPSINTLLATTLEAALDPRSVCVVQGDAQVAQQLSESSSDFVLFTGGSHVGKQVYQECAERLIPCALELGGSCAAIVDGTFDLDLAAKRIAWAKFTNAGQTCVAVNHVVVLRKHHDFFVAALEKWIGQMFPHASASKKIVNDNHVNRVQNLLKHTKGHVSRPTSWEDDEDARLISPTVVSSLSSSDPLVEAGEIFGPVCPVIAVDTIEDAVRLTKKQGSPLALYIFSEDKHVRQLVISSVQSGAVVYNDAMLHMGLSELPFGGVGSSGFGRYHGKRTYDLFTYERSYMTSPGWSEPLLKLRYPPISDASSALLRFLLYRRITFPRPGQPTLWQSLRNAKALLAALAIIIAVLARPRLQLRTLAFVRKYLPYF